MIVIDDARALVADLWRRMAPSVLSHRVRARHPTLHAHPTVLWNDPFRRPDARFLKRVGEDA